MTKQEPGLYGITYSNRDFTQAEAWGKNQFNSSFPIGLTNLIYSKGLGNIYLCLDKELKINHGKISAEQLYGISPVSDDLFFSFESPCTSYQQFIIGSLPRVDLVTQIRSTGQCLRPIEIKLTALPDNSTCSLTEEYYGCEIVVRPNTIIYLACSIVTNFKENQEEITKFIGDDFGKIKDWNDSVSIWSNLTQMILAIDRIVVSLIDKQEPLLMQPIWKTNGRSPELANNCLDVFIWSNLAFTQLFTDAARDEISAGNKRITRQVRTVIWLFKMLYEFGIKGQINYYKIIDELSYNTKNDKAFSANGRVTHKYMSCEELTNPRIGKREVKNIILGGGQNLLSPERRFDAIIYNYPELFR